MTAIRPMTPDDVDGVVAVVQAANEALDGLLGRPRPPRSDEQDRQFRAGMTRFVERDPDGAWVAVEGDTVVGMAEAVRRGRFWGLAMLFVDPSAQGRGLGRRLLDATLTYAEGAAVRMILTSSDPRALRRYSMAGLAIHPAVEATGRVDRSTIPPGLPGRSGDRRDLDLVAAVDSRLRGSRAEDVEYLLAVGQRMVIIDHRAGQGFAVFRDTRLTMLGATDEATATQLLWRVLGEAGEEIEIWGLTARQDWAVRVALAAHLRVAAAGPLFIDGLRDPPGPWVPSGWYF